MKKVYHIIVQFVLIAMVIAMPVYAANSVPAQVLNAADSVVRVFSEYQDGWATGSGFVISNNKNETLIATNYHVIEDNPIEISVWTEEVGDLTTVSVVTSSEYQDLCILRLTGNYHFRALPLNLDAQKGDEVYAVGFPGAADALSDKVAYTSADATITDGIISAERVLTISNNGTPVSLFQISAAINSGNSGGPLLNSKGAVVGINTYGVQGAEGVNAAIAASELLQLATANNIKLQNTSRLWVILIAVIAFAACILLSAILVKMRKRKGKSVSLRSYITQLQHGLTPEQAVSLLMTVAVELRNMHEDGRPHLQISPDTVFLNNGKAVLAAPKPDENNRYTNGFAAPEIYKGSNCGQLSDIYSFCAVILYTISGVVPKNSLSRKNIIQSLNSDCDRFQAVIEKGMELDAMHRYGSMRELILDISPYNTMATVPEILETCDSAKNPEKKKLKRCKNKVLTAKQKVRLAVISLIVIVFLTIGGYFGTYFFASNYANQGDFISAERYLLFPQITSLHDPLLADYIEAGQLFVRKNYQAAEDAFRNSIGYRNSEYYYTESNYQRGLGFYGNSDYQNAMAIFSELSERDYKDAKSLALCASALNEIYPEKEISPGLFLMRFLKAKNRVNELKIVDGNRAEIIENEINQVTYKIAMEAFNEEDYSNSKPIFKNLGEYSNSDKYRILCSIAIGDFTDNDFITAVNNINFANTKRLLLSNNRSARQFLKGTWKTKDGLYYFQLSGDNSMVSCNFPHVAQSNTTYCIIDGYYCLIDEKSSDAILEAVKIKHSRSSQNAQFRMSVLTSNSIKIEYIKTGNTYTLYRQ